VFDARQLGNAVESAQSLRNGTIAFVRCRARTFALPMIPWECCLTNAVVLPLRAIMFGVLLFGTYVPESFMWLPRALGFAR
jgi:hypothetical protein